MSFVGFFLSLYVSLSFHILPFSQPSHPTLLSLVTSAQSLTVRVMQGCDEAIRKQRADREFYVCWVGVYVCVCVCVVWAHFVKHFPSPIPLWEFTRSVLVRPKPVERQEFADFVLSHQGCRFQKATSGQMKQRVTYYVITVYQACFGILFSSASFVNCICIVVMQ